MVIIQYFRFHLVAILIGPCIFTNAYYYCDKQGKLCGAVNHFMCDLDSVPIKGDFLAHLPLTGKVKSLYIDRHNELRNKLAGGEQEFKGGGKFPKATRMREVLWDDELAYIAGIHAKRCNMQHDACRSTERFPGSGQNLYIHGTSVKPENISQHAVLSVDAWWSEYKYVDDGDALADEFPKGVADWSEVGHFTAMANEIAAFVGCGLALCKNCSNGYCIEVTCNYSLTNLQGAPMYKKGDTSASECDFYKSSPSSKYPHLCENTGEIFKN